MQYLHHKYSMWFNNTVLQIQIMKTLHQSVRLLVMAIMSVTLLSSYAAPPPIQESDACRKLRNDTIVAARNCIPKAGMSREDLLVFWPESHIGNFRPWRGKGREGQYHEIDLDNLHGPGSIRIILCVWYNDGNVESATLSLPNMIDDEIVVDTNDVKLPIKKSDEEILRDSLDLLTRLTERLKTNGWKSPNSNKAEKEMPNHKSEAEQ